MEFKHITSRYPRLSRDEEIELGRLSRAGNIDARNKLVMHNLKLALKFIQKYPYQKHEDLFPVAVMGLVKAAERFDPSKGCRFSTYSFEWMRQAVIRHLQKDSLIYLPPATKQNLKGKSTLSTAQKKTVEMMTRCESVGSLNVRTGKRDSLSVIDMVTDTNLSPLEYAERVEMAEKMQQAIEKANLSERHRFVLFRFYGVGCESQTLHEIAAEMGVSFNHVKNIKLRALTRLKKHSLNLAA